MTETKTDPRILRTRKLIMDSFIDLSSKKEFKDITIKDITTEAMINRATFYYHFEDIYDLLDKALTEVLFVNLNFEDYKDSDFDEDTFVRIFTAITDFQTSLSNRCHRGYEDTIARIIRDQLEVILYSILKRKHPSDADEGLKLSATMLSWGLYGASVEWRRSSNTVSPEEFIKTVTPYLD
ncbi:TetR/AcrR family transcriptional regulator [Ornithinibacillus halotolerans]|uniref:TetR family transcriptional regulator n=1 Tax=Ornithinibacillus halotolerans TaxID=1274357 RepID=A0A916RY68_9BACI|nr:TetR/AcrR family transcriptional regulator [Ornithinibacillus halotolerans]GGA72600.1 TetR family transcriptional regulator [Ornithinibacillus halotolerans]